MQVSTKNAWKKLHKKAKLGDPKAQLEIATYYADGLDDLVKTNIKKAIKWFKLSAKQGDESAQNWLGVIYSSSEYGSVNLKKAKKWTLKAIDQGSAPAAFNMGTIHRDMGNLKKAFKWYKRSLKMGEKEANFDLFLCHYFGVGTKQNKEKAKKHLKIMRGFYSI